MNKLVVVRGGGDLASGVVHKLVRCGFSVVVLEVPKPTFIRKSVSFADAIYEGEAEVEGVVSKHAGSVEEIRTLLKADIVPVVIDPEGDYITRLKPLAVIDSVMAKHNTGTRLSMAPIVIALGPGFNAGADVHAVIETNRGHNLGKVILEGAAHANTDIPGEIAGYTHERIIRADVSGVVTNLKEIGELVKKGDIICTVGGISVEAAVDGVVRGLIRTGTIVTKRMKIGDIDPRGEKEYCYTISDKARAIAGGVLEALLYLNHTRAKVSSISHWEVCKC